MIRKLQPIVVPTSGTDGSAVGSGATPSPVSGWVVGVHLDYSATQASTADVTITATNPTLTVLVKANSATDAWYFPRVAASLNTDGSAITGEYLPGIPVDGYLSIAVAQADDGESVTVTFLVDVR
jgi:hypothetical protein